MDEKQQDQEYYNSINKYLSFLDTVSLNANGDATVKLITQTINKYANTDFIKKVTARIDSIATDEYDFCKKLFDISCRLIKYRMDPKGHEMVWTPKLLIQVRQGDCKKFTTFICCVLKCKGITSASKVVNYDKGSGWQHIYAIAKYPNDKGYLTIDPVNKQRWDTEVRFREGRVNYYNGTYSKLIMNKLSMMGNIPNSSGNAIDEILGDVEDIAGTTRNFNRNTKGYLQQIEDSYINGTHYDEIEGAPDDDESIAAKKNPAKAAKQQARKKKRAEKKPARVEKRKKIFKKVKKVGFGPVRAAFLALIFLGAELEKTHLKVNLAKKLAQLWQKDGGASLKKIWAQFGGKPDALKQAIIKASKVQISGEMDEEIGAAAAVGAAAMITAASPLLVAVFKLMHDKKVMAKNEAMRSVDATEKTTDENTDKDGNLLANVSDVMKASTKVIDEVVKIDQGGDKQTTDLIKTTATTNDPNPTAPPPPGGDGTTKTAAGFSLVNPSSWITGSLMAPIICQAGHIPGASIVSSCLLIGGLFLIVKSFFK